MEENMLITQQEWLQEARLFLSTLKGSSGGPVPYGTPTILVSGAERIPPELDTMLEKGGHTFSISFHDGITGAVRRCCLTKYEGSNVTTLCCVDGLIPKVFIDRMMAFAHKTGTVFDLQVLST